jgi:hypothetical protein
MGRELLGEHRRDDQQAKEEQAEHGALVADDQAQAVTQPRQGRVLVGGVPSSNS